jgi:hypothetical protein
MWIRSSPLTGSASSPRRNRSTHWGAGAGSLTSAALKKARLTVTALVAANTRQASPQPPSPFLWRRLSVAVHVHETDGLSSRLHAERPGELDDWHVRFARTGFPDDAGMRQPAGGACPVFPCYAGQAPVRTIAVEDLRRRAAGAPGQTRCGEPSSTGSSSLRYAASECAVMSMPRSSSASWTRRPMVTFRTLAMIQVTTKE